MTSGFPDHFSAVANGYAAFRPSYPPALADYLAGLAPARQVAWDAGCGSGQMSALLAMHFARVAATDASAAQIGAAVPHPRIDYRCRRAEDSGLPAASVDLAIAAQAVHWFALDAYYAEVRRVLVPRGVVALVAYGLMQISADIDPLVELLHNQLLAPYWPPERKHIETGYRALPFPFDAVAAPPFWMEADWTLEQLFGYLDTWSAVQAWVKSDGGIAWLAFRHRLGEVFGPHEAQRGVRWPLVLRVGIAHA